MTIDKLVDTLDKAVYGQTRSDVWELCVCLNCQQKIRNVSVIKEPGDIATPEGRAEYKISGLCEYCFDGLFAEEEDEEPSPF